MSAKLRFLEAEEEQRFTLPASSDFTVLSGRGQSSPLFPDLVSDDWKAYVQFKINHALPNVSGPEMHGRYFGFHPQVLANSHRSLLHQQTNLGHTLKAYGGYRDRIVGTVVGVAFPDNLGRRWEVGDDPEAAPFMSCVAVIHKLAQGVSSFLGKHSTSQRMSVSIEAIPRVDDLWVFDPGDKSIVTLDDFVASHPEVVTMDKKKGIQIGQLDGRQLAFAPGGEEGEVPFRGVGYVPLGNQAEPKARITDFKAQSESGQVFLAATAQREWDAGMDVSWEPVLAHDAGRGTVVEVIEEGEIPVSGRVMRATPADPVLRVKVAGKTYDVLRTPSYVRACD